MWAIKRSIDKKGFKGIPGLLTEPLGVDNINLLLNQVMDGIAGEFSEGLIKLFR